MTLYSVRLENQRGQLIAESKQDALNRTTAALRALDQSEYTDCREIGVPIHGAREVSLLFSCRNARRCFRQVTVRVTELEPRVSLGPWKTTAATHRAVPGPGPEWE